MDTKQDSKPDNGDQISIEDLVHWQDSLKKDIDLSKPDSEMTPEELAKKAIYLSVDKVVEESLGKETKQELDEKRKKVELLGKFRDNLHKLTELGREIEKNLIWQGAYLINHFDKSENNVFRVAVDKTTTDIVDAKNNMTASERIEYAKKIIEFIKKYREKFVGEMTSKQEIISAILLSLDKTLKETNFKIYAEVGDVSEADKMQSQFSEWLSLTNKLLEYRSKAIEAVKEHLDMDDLLPKYVIQNNGDISKNLSGIELKTKGERMVKLINEADEKEKEIEEKRSKLSEELFGKPEDYIEPVKNDDSGKSQNQQIISANPLQDKAWFRLAKVIYIGAFGLSLLIGLSLFEESAWFLIGAIIFFILVRKAFYYVVLGKTNWK